jgi:hypothetical protein
MLKELLQCTMSRPQFFLGGLSLLSELLPIPLPINTLEVREIEEKQLGPNHISEPPSEIRKTSFILI